MAMTIDGIMTHEARAHRGSVTARDAILYALSTGYGVDDRDFVTGLVPRIAPSMANVICHPGFFMQALGATWAGVVHAEQRLILHEEIPLGEVLSATTRAVAVVDKGPGRGAFVTFERRIHRASGGAPLVTVSQTDACRFDGGCGSAGIPPEPLAALPERAPDHVEPLVIPREAALLYQLNGDTNPLHTDPEVARRAGFDAPILHGLCGFGHAARMLARLQPRRLSEIAARFVAAIHPGETLALDLWQEADSLRFRLRVPARGVTAIDRGFAQLD